MGCTLEECFRGPDDWRSSLAQHRPSSAATIAWTVWHGGAITPGSAVGFIPGVPLDPGNVEGGVRSSGQFFGFVVPTARLAAGGLVHGRHRWQLASNPARQRHRAQRGVTDGDQRGHLCHAGCEPDFRDSVASASPGFDGRVYVPGLLSALDSGRWALTAISEERRSSQAGPARPFPSAAWRATASSNSPARSAPSVGRIRSRRRFLRVHDRRAGGSWPDHDGVSYHRLRPLSPSRPAWALLGAGLFAAAAHRRRRRRGAPSTRHRLLSPVASSR